VGLTMEEKKSITREMACKYLKYSIADRKGKHRILDDFVHVSEYNRKYAIHLLANWGKVKLRTVEGKLVRFVVGKPTKRRKRAPRRIYGQTVRKAVQKLWQLFDYMCGKRLAVPALRVCLPVLYFA
jgi:hypothetical protein